MVPYRILTTVLMGPRLILSPHVFNHHIRVHFTIRLLINRDRELPEGLGVSLQFAFYYFEGKEAA